MIKDYQQGNITHFVVFRRVGSSLRRSIWKATLEILEFLGLSNFVNINTTLLTITFNWSGQTIQMIGLDDGNKVKGLKFEKGYPKYSFFEELADFENFENIEVVLDSIIRLDLASAAKKIDREFVFLYAFNPPRDKNHWINEHWDNLPENVFKLHSTYEDIIHWLPTNAIERVMETKENDFKTYQWRYLGIAIGTDGLVYHSFDYHKHVTDSLLPKERIMRVVVGCDEGVMRDATTLVPLAITNLRRIVVLPTMYYDPILQGNVPLAPTKQIQIMNGYFKTITQQYKFHMQDLQIIIDSAASALYKQIQLDTNWAIKKVTDKNVVEDAKLLQEILSRPGLVYFIDKGYYCYNQNKMIKGKDMLITELEHLKFDDKGRPEDKGNHAIDACKYASKELRKIGLV